MKIIIAGNGKVGLALTKQLSAEGYDITLIDSNSRVLETSIEKFDIIAVYGNCASMDVLEKADVQSADVLIAATSADEINLLCCLTAHIMNPNLHTIARIRNPEYHDQVYKMRDAFALSLVVNPEQQAAAEIERILKYPGFLKRDTFAKGRVEIVELKIGSDSKLRDVRLPDLQKVIKCKVLVCAVTRDGKTIVPHGDFQLKENDRLFVSAPIETLSILLTNLGLLTRRVRSAVLCGGGRVGYYLAQRLVNDNVSVRIIENDYDRCVQLAEMLPKVSITHGDASDPSLLEAESADESDAIIAMTGMDEQNIIISLYGKSMNIKHIVTKLGHMDSRGVLDSLPIGSVVSPKELCTNTIVRYVRAMQNQVGAATAVHEIADGEVEALEFVVDENTLHCGEKLVDIRLRKNVLLASISSGARTVIPSGSSSFKVGDTVVVISSGDYIIHQLNDIFE